MAKTEVNEIAKAKLIGKIGRGLATTAGFIIGGELTARGLSKLNPYATKKKKKKKKKTIAPVVPPKVTEAPVNALVTKIVTTNPLTLSKRVRKVKNIPDLYKDLKPPEKRARKGQPVDEKAIKIIKTLGKVAKALKPHRKLLAKGAISGAGWAALDTAGKVVSKKSVDKAALNLAMRDAEHNARKRYGAVEGPRKVKAAVKKVKADRSKEQNEAKRLSLAKKVGILAAGSVASDIAGDLIAGYLRDKGKEVKKKGIKIPRRQVKESKIKIKKEQIKKALATSAKEKAIKAGKALGKGATVIGAYALLSKIARR